MRNDHISMLSDPENFTDNSKNPFSAKTGIKFKKWPLVNCPMKSEQIKST